MEAATAGQQGGQRRRLTWRGRSVAEVLALTVRAACDFFEGDEPLAAMARAMDDLGLEEYLPSPFQELEGLEQQENERQLKEGKLNIAGDDGMMSQKQYQDLYAGSEAGSVILRKLK